MGGCGGPLLAGGRMVAGVRGGRPCSQLSARPLASHLFGLLPQPDPRGGLGADTFPRTPGPRDNRSATAPWSPPTPHSGIGPLAIARAFPPPPEGS